MASESKGLVFATAVKKHAGRAKEKVFASILLDSKRYSSSDSSSPLDNTARFASHSTLSLQLNTRWSSQRFSSLLTSRERGLDRRLLPAARIHDLLWSMVATGCLIDTTHTHTFFIITITALPLILLLISLGVFPSYVCCKCFPHLFQTLLIHSLL